MKKAVIDQLLLGAILFSIFVLFVATVNDVTAARNKVYDLKNLADTGVNAAGTYYLDIEENKANAEAVAYSIFDQTKLGTETKPLANFIWDEASSPKRLTLNINNYIQENFWYRFFNLNLFNLDAQSVGILDNGEVTNFVPIVVNGCSKTFQEGDTFEYLLKAYNLYDQNDNVGFYGAYVPGGGQSSFSHLKNLVDNVMKDTLTVENEFDLDDSLNVATVDSSVIDNDVKQIAQSFAISSFSDTPMSIAEAQCGSAADNLVIKRVFEITMNGVYCGDGCLNPAATNNCSLEDLTGGVFDDMAWDTAVSSCNSESFFKIEFTINKIREREVVIQ